MQRLRKQICQMKRIVYPLKLGGSITRRKKAVKHKRIDIPDSASIFLNIG